MTDILTKNAVLDFYTSPTATSIKAPKTVQVLKVVATPLPTGASRYRMIISDGKHFINTCMPSKRASESLLVTGQVEKNSLVRITEYALKEVNDKRNPGKTTRLVLATSMELLQDAPHEGGRIGEPSDVAKDAAATRRRVAANSSAASGLAPAGAPAVRQKARGSGGDYDAISSLNPYRNRWTIKARVTKRGDKKTWSNARGEGCLFSVDLLDAEGTEIRATFWKEAVDMFYEMLAPGIVATFAGGKLKVANKQWTSIKNDYEITFDRSATIVPLEEEDDSIKAIVFDFAKLAHIEAMEVKSNVDVVGVVKEFQPVSSLIAKSDGRELWKRDVTLADDSGVAVRLTLWGEEAQKDDSTFAGNPVLCVKGARVGEFQGKNLSTGFGSTLLYNDTAVPEVVALQSWWASTGSSAVMKSLSTGGGGGQRGRFEDRKGLSVIREENLGYKEKPDWVDCKASVAFLKSDGTFCYPACPEEGNNKKVTEQSDGTWVCDANGKTYDSPEWRYILSFRATDHTGSTFVTAFNEQALEIMGGTTAGELKQLQETDPAAFEAKFQQALFKELVMTVRCKAETYKDEMRVRVSMQRGTPVNYVAESRQIIDALKAM